MRLRQCSGVPHGQQPIYRRAANCFYPRIPVALPLFQRIKDAWPIRVIELADFFSGKQIIILERTVASQLA